MDYKDINYCRSRGTASEQDYCVQVEKEYCDQLEKQNFSENYCRPIFDKILCWDATPPNTIVSLPCPQFVAGFDIPGATATKECLENGKWFFKESTEWTNYSLCYNKNQVTISVPVPTISYGNESFIEEYVPIIKNISRAGYCISLSTLIVAFCIMFAFKKLHCARNKLHMHLFASFIFRAAVFFIKDLVFKYGGLGIIDIQERNGSKYVVDHPSINWQCKLVASLWQYFITANYSWILMEGVYLHNLILLALFTDSSNSIKYYILFGWGLPAIVVGAYVIARVYLDNTLCWLTYEKNRSIILIIKIPTIISFLINFVLFINIARVLLLKLKSPISEETKLFRRWARSTLVLVPLFGIHYVVFIGMNYYSDVNPTIDIIWLFCDQLFASFQGFFVAVLYCFLNGEVKTELRPHVNNFLALWQSAPFNFLNCSEFSRSTAGRPSVCTTLSCSSLYTSSVNQKYPGRRSKWDITQANEKFLENYHTCQPNNEKNSTDQMDHILQYDSMATLKCTENSCYSSKGSTQLTDITEITACLGDCDHNTKIESSVDLEMITIAKQ